MFKKAHGLDYPLLSDEKGEIAAALGVPTRDGGEFKTTVDGAAVTLVRGVTASRWTFVVSKDGKVAYKNTKVNAGEDSKDVLSVLVELRAKEEAALGFRSLFDGASLGAWSGDPRFWRVEGGAIVGETTAEVRAEANTFLVLRSEEFANFEIRFRYKVAGYNSGFQYRAKELENWRVVGYQADFEADWHPDGPADHYSGMLYEEGGRGFLTPRGQAVVVRSDASAARGFSVERIGSVGDPEELAACIRRDGWNDYTIVADGATLTHLINGRVFAFTRDEDAAHRSAKGIIAFQLHSGPSMRIDIKDVRLRALD